MAFSHEKIETNNALMILLILLTVSVGGLVQIVPLFFQKSTTEPAPGVKPYTALQLAGRDVYQREGCYNCHSQMIRPFRAETLRYGPYSVAGESVYDHPFQWGSKRTGPDLARVGGRYSDEWHRIHLNNPRDVVPESNMPAYYWLAEGKVDGDTIQQHMRALRTVGVPYTDEQIAKAPDEVRGRTELDAVIAYLQGLGRARAPRAATEGVVVPGVNGAPATVPVAPGTTAPAAPAPGAAAPAGAAPGTTAPATGGTPTTSGAAAAATGQPR